MIRDSDVMSGKITNFNHESRMPKADRAGAADLLDIRHQPHRRPNADLRMHVRSHAEMPYRVGQVNRDWPVTFVLRQHVPELQKRRAVVWRRAQVDFHA